MKSVVVMKTVVVMTCALSIQEVSRARCCRSSVGPSPGKLKTKEQRK